MTTPFRARLARIVVYPIKSLDGVAVESVAVTAAGSLANDRRWMLTDAAGRPINGKGVPRLHQVRTAFDLGAETVTVTGPEAGPVTLHLLQQAAEVERWFSDVLGQRVSLKENAVGGFPDDLDDPGPTLISTAS